jgi:sodium-dependent phosphate cotransporter
MADELEKASPLSMANEPTVNPWVRGLQVVALLFIFLVGIRGLGDGFKGLGKELLEGLFMVTSNPFIGLAVGILATTLVQSSSVTTAMIVGLVGASDNALPVENAVPMIMGANIGTTVTNTVVSLGSVGRRDEFRRAFAAATCHDFFNFMAVAILLPLEIATGVLTKVSLRIAALVGSSSGPGKMPNPLKVAIKGVVGLLKDVLEAVGASGRLHAVLLIAVSGLVIFTALYFIVKVLRVLAATRLQTYITRSFEKSAYIGIAIGAVVTVMVQSSSITTSVMVPLAAAAIITVEQVFPVTIGANIGTTITAMLASMAAPENTGVQIAMVHLLFNLSATALIYPFERVRQLPIRAAKWLANVAVDNKKAALAYVVGLFYGLPALLIFVSRAL